MRQVRNMSRIREILNSRSGYTLTEVLAAGVILILISTVTLRGFRLSGEMLLRSGKLINLMADTQERIAMEQPEDYKRSKILTFTAESGESAQLQVTENIYLIGSGKDAGKLNWRILEPKESDR